MASKIEGHAILKREEKAKEGGGAQDGSPPVLAYILFVSKYRLIMALKLQERPLALGKTNTVEKHTQIIIHQKT